MTQISGLNKKKSLNHSVNGNLNAGNVLKSKPVFPRGRPFQWNSAVAGKRLLCALLNFIKSRNLSRLSTRNSLEKSSAFHTRPIGATRNNSSGYFDIRRAFGKKKEHDCDKRTIK